MRHFYSKQHLLDGIRDEAERQGCSILERKGRVYAIAGMSCECGRQSITDVDLTEVADRLWAEFSGSPRTEEGNADA
ncbi:hypothetical protein [Shinella sp. BYT-45]|uniref:hypothetical protein n=1 Tax=Shinella sp. BYT-45 TaxID=3377377 RepID=UPI0039800CF0